MRPPAVAQEALAFGDAAGGRHHQREAEVGGRFSQHVRRVADQDVARGAGGDVDVVVADRHRAHRAQAGAGVEQCGVDLLVGGDEGAGLALQPRDQFGLCEHAIFLVGIDVEMLR